MRSGKREMSYLPVHFHCNVSSSKQKTSDPTLEYSFVLTRRIEALGMDLGGRSRSASSRYKDIRIATLRLMGNR